MDINVIFTLVPRLLPTFMLGIVALLGLLFQRKSTSEVISGTIKTMAGVIILFTAVDLLVGTISPLSEMFGTVYTYGGGAELKPVADFTIFLGQYGLQVVLVMVFGFLVNVLLARFTPLKYVFLSGHILFWNAFMVTAALADSGVLKGTALVIIGSIVLGILSTVLPALLAPSVRKLTGSNDFTIGHTTTSLAIVGVWVAKLFGDESKSTEDMEIPESLSFFKEMVISTSLIMVLLYLIIGIIAGPQGVADTYAGGQVWIWFIWTIFKGISFGAGLVILLTGVRMMLAEIIPAFHGIAAKVVPNAVPALDCPMVFPYAPNALAIGFPIAMVTSLITLIIFGSFGYSYVLLPLVVAAFFDAGPAAILGNAVGGRRGAILAAAVGGVLLIVLQALSLPFIANSAGSFIQAFGGNDFSLIAIVVGGIAKLLGL
ncbi:MAG: PTS ascorbate transporter subunit IIC [Chloroflexi bacterium]|nr:MAG: PTS ascorbate transporter subunit IIC [Chloroflexota bacterium]